MRFLTCEGTVKGAVGEARRKKETSAAGVDAVAIETMSVNVNLAARTATKSAAARKGACAAVRRERIKKSIIGLYRSSKNEGFAQVLSD